MQKVPLGKAMHHSSDEESPLNLPGFTVEMLKFKESFKTLVNRTHFQGTLQCPDKCKRSLTQH